MEHLGLITHFLVEGGLFSNEFLDIRIVCTDGYTDQPSLVHKISRKDETNAPVRIKLYFIRTDKTKANNTTHFIQLEWPLNRIDINPRWYMQIRTQQKPTKL